MSLQYGVCSNERSCMGSVDQFLLQRSILEIRRNGPTAPSLQQLLIANVWIELAQGQPSHQA